MGEILAGLARRRADHPIPERQPERAPLAALDSLLQPVPLAVQLQPEPRRPLAILLLGLAFLLGDRLLLGGSFFLDLGDLLLRRVERLNG